MRLQKVKGMQSQGGLNSGQLCPCSSFMSSQELSDLMTSTRPFRWRDDKLAAIRNVWDGWLECLPLMYNPGPEVTVDERLVPFRGRRPFKQYIQANQASMGSRSGQHVMPGAATPGICRFTQGNLLLEGQKNNKACVLCWT